MTQDIKNINAKEGLGILKFGMSREEVKAILGEANEIESFSYTDSDDDMTESWHYDALDLSLGFDQEGDWHLISIAITSNAYLFKDKELIGLSEDALVEALNSMDIDQIVIEDVSEDESSSQYLVSCENIGVNFWLEDDLVTEIQWTPLND